MPVRQQISSHIPSSPRPRQPEHRGSAADTAVIAAVEASPVDGVADDDGLDAELAAAARHTWWNKWTVYLGGALLVVGGFVAGGEVQRAYGEPTASSVPGVGQRGAAGLGGFPAGVPSAFPSGGAADEGSDATTGTVKLVDGTTVYVETESGEVVTVRTNGETAVSIPGLLKDLKAGDKLSVEGDVDSGGSVTAKTISESK